MSKSFKKVLVSLLVSAAVLSLAGCGSSGSSTTTSSAKISGEINGGGSTSVQKVIDAAGSEFSALNPDVKFTYSGTGSSDGIKGATAGTYSFGCASRDLKAEEKANLTELVFAYDGIAVVVNPANTVSNLTKDQIAKIYMGEITNWSEVGGADAPIVVVSREDGSGTRSATEELIGFAEKLKPDATIKEGNGNVQTTIAGNQNSIGYVSLTFVDKTVKAVDVDGVKATVDNVKNKSYAISRPFLALYDKSKVDDATLAFLDFLMTDDGQAIVQKEGAITV
ncbi:phosphate ABC transporter substrate-binding protein [Acetobacterium woodii]|uniref:Phosphate-binding protein n=1 Tax=Acetobacterium woodii (strain ATCC 29683 / DSM 1030 / JCM 2381 / KCTC 1655 / WB1) TaxID=931626 RepID=H6LD93_ACEWD|nr:phosphate ABC transporter substrate-binding protein [Acetobacterium woodii]AFA49138.1 phosphate transport system phosphate-binding protein PstS [Acetobacterium woodii DSM 1030]